MSFAYSSVPSRRYCDSFAAVAPGKTLRMRRMSAVRLTTARRFLSRTCFHFLYSSGERACRISCSFFARTASSWILLASTTLGSRCPACERRLRRPGCSISCCLATIRIFCRTASRPWLNFIRRLCVPGFSASSNALLARAVVERLLGMFSYTPLFSPNSTPC